MALRKATLAELVADRHQSVKDIARFFGYEHLREDLQGTSRRVYDLAYDMIASIPDSAELVAGLRKLLEAKDAFVRAAL